MYHIECICIDIIYIYMSNPKKKVDDSRTAFSKYVRGIITIVVMLYFFVGVIFIHKISASDDALHTIFPTDNHTKLIPSWFIGRLVSELSYKTLDANNRNVHSFLRAMRNVKGGVGYILFVMLVIGLFSVISTLWLVYGAIITFGQAFIFNMTLPIGWIRSLIILWSVGVASLISGAVMVLYNFIMIFYIPFNYSGNLQGKCGNNNPTLKNVCYANIPTLIYLALMGLAYITSGINFSTKSYHNVQIGIKVFMLVATIVFLSAELFNKTEFSHDNMKCNSTKKGVYTDDELSNHDIFNAILSGDKRYVPTEKMEELSNDFTRFLYTRLLEGKMAESGTFPSKAMEEFDTEKKAAEELTDSIKTTQAEIDSIANQLVGIVASLKDVSLSVEDKEGYTNKYSELSETKSKLEQQQKTMSEALGRAKAIIEARSPNKPAKPLGPELGVPLDPPERGGSDATPSPEVAGGKSLDPPPSPEVAGGKSLDPPPSAPEEDKLTSE